MIHVFIDLQHRRLVPAPIAIVRCTKDRHNTRLMALLIPLKINFLNYLMHQLVRPRNLGKPVRPIEHLTDILPKGESGSSRALSPTNNVVWVAPKEVAHRPIMRYLSEAIQLPYRIQSSQFRAQTSMETENLVFHHSSDREMVEKISQIFPYIG